MFIYKIYICIRMDIMSNCILNKLVKRVSYMQLALRWRRLHLTLTTAVPT